MIHEIKWTVIKWKEHWRTIWFPTANISLEKDEVFDGTYKVNVIIDWKIYHWVWNARNKVWVFESYIFDFNKDIYWKEIEVIVLEKIRDNIEINSIKDLKPMIEKDVAYAKTRKNYVLTFGTFDLVHEGHKFFLESAKRYWDVLVTILATDKSIEKFKNVKPMNSIEKRKEDLHKLWVSDIIWVWDENNPLKWIELYSPCVVCLWYDQIWYSNELAEYKKQYNIEIVRLPSFKADIYKSSKLKKDLPN